MKKYSCLNCVNNNSPLCEYCSTTEASSGKQKKPRYFIQHSRVVVSEGVGTDIVKRILRCQSIPLELVMCYNEKVAPLEALGED